MEEVVHVSREQKVQLVRADLEKTKHEYVHKEGGGYRPNGVFVLYKIIEGKPKYLLTLANNPTVIEKDEWFLAQGGVGVDPLEENESLEDNLFQEVNTELSITQDQLQNIQVGIVDPFSVDYKPGRNNFRNKKNPEKGKRYYFSSAEYIGDEKLLHNDEIHSYRWGDYDETVAKLQGHSNEKSIRALDALEKVNASLEENL